MFKARSNLGTTTNPEPTVSIRDLTWLGAIQIIRDTLGGGGGKTKCHVNFFTVLNSDFKAFGSKKS